MNGNGSALAAIHVVLSSLLHLLEVRLLSFICIDIFQVCTCVVHNLLTPRIVYQLVELNHSL